MDEIKDGDIDPRILAKLGPLEDGQKYVVFGADDRAPIHPLWIGYDAAKPGLKVNVTPLDVLDDTLTEATKAWYEGTWGKLSDEQLEQNRLAKNKFWGVQDVAKRDPEKYARANAAFADLFEKCVEDKIKRNTEFTIDALNNKMYKE